MSELYGKVTEKLLKSKTQKQKHSKGAKKETHDLFVQGTNDSSIVSKRSVEILYSLPVDNNQTQYFQHFVKKVPRRSPVINRGYWIRMRSIRMAVEKIISQQPLGQRINIINLGCGYDPLPFQLLDDQNINQKNLFCIDIDYPELAGYKSQMIKMAPELMEITGNEVEKTHSGVAFQSGNYALLGCDLTDKELYTEQLASLKALEINTTNIFIAEVSLAYMTPETANPIIKTSSSFSNSHFLILEQLMPKGENHPFAKRMVNHFKKMEAPLQCVHTYPTIQHQIERFKDLGYNSVNATDLLGCWGLVDHELRSRVANVEVFDEWEEFCWFGQHYINLHATNQLDVQVYYEKPPLSTDLTKTKTPYKFNVDPVKIERKFHTCLSTSSDSFYTCGTNQSRLSSTICLNGDSKVVTSNEFKARVAATSVTINGAAYLIGGRRMPGSGIDEFWKLKDLNGEFLWEQLASLPNGCVKHSTVEYNGDIILYNKGSIYQYNISTDKWHSLSVSNSIILESANLVNLNGTIYLYGGLIGNSTEFEFNETMYKLDFTESGVQLIEIFKHPALGRYGSQCASIKENKLVILGGVGKTLFGQNDTFIEVDLINNEVFNIHIDDDAWESSNPIVGSSVISKNNKITIVGGGAICYGFGSVWGGLMTVQI